MKNSGDEDDDTDDDKYDKYSFRQLRIGVLNYDDAMPENL